MNRNSVPRQVRVSASIVGVAAIAALAGCSSGGADATTDSGNASQESNATTTYTDGSYTANGTYQTPGTVEEVTVKVTLESGVITEVSVEGDPQATESKQFQSRFIGGISDEVVGKSIDDIDVSRVAGSSLTSGGFNQAIETIREEAAA